ncbi:MAG: GNAT family N-acetyltransferase [Clostridia bacterium]|nr:GNAT family N-acetyltransferase [Clostridia bacterium]
MLEENTLTYEEYIDIIGSIGWKYPSKRLLELSLKNSMTVKYKIEEKTVGMARLVTDNGYIALVADVIVKPEYQGQGIGKKMIENLLFRAKETLEEGEAMMIQLLAADGKMEFYKKFGFKDKKEVVEAGMYMWFNKN